MNRAVKLFLVFSLAFSCNSEDDSNNPIVEAEEGEPAITEIGTPTADPVVQEIGPGGGTISAADSKLDITVPAGAVTANTTFSIQPITNFCPGGMRAYRLLPEGLSFGKPVTLTFHYTDDDLEGTLTDFFGIAFQGSDGAWYRMPAVVDDTKKIITTQATHFTNWTVLSQLAIAPRTPAVPEIWQVMR